MPKLTADELSRLCKAVESSRIKLRDFRTARTEIVRLVAGSNWNTETARKQRPVNLLWQFQQTITRSLVPKCPRFTLKTWNHADEPTVGTMQLWMNRQAERMNLAATFRRWVIDGLYGWAVVKVAIANPADAAAAGYNLRAGDAMVSNIDLDDYFVDMYARTLSAVTYEGHSYRVPLDVVKRSTAFAGKARDKLDATNYRLFNNAGDERVGTLGVSYSNGPVDEFEDFVELCEVYLPLRRRVVTLPCDTNGLPRYEYGALADAEWVGPDCGPFHHLRFGEVPGNLPPVGPMMQLADLDRGVNKIYRKLIAQAFRQKTNLLVRAGQEDDGKRITQANDGDAVPVANPQDAKEYRFGGADQVNMVFGDGLRALFDRQAGGLAILQGAAPQSPTAAQDKILNDNAGAGVQDMADVTTSAISQVGHALGWFFWHNPYLEMRMREPMPNNVGLTYTRRATFGDRQRGRWDDVDLRVDPYSLVFQSPRQRFQAITGVVTNLYVPFAQMAQQAGVSLDFPALFKLAAEYLDQPDLKNLLSLEEPPPEAVAAAGAGGGGAGPGVRPAETTRNYVRQSMPTRTEEGDRLNRQNAMMGINPGGNRASANQGGMS